MNAFEFKSRIIKDGSILFPDVIESTTCRNEEKPILESLDILLQNKPPTNFYIYGPSGSGKTAICKHIISHALEKTGNILCVYVNCWSYSSSMVIYTKIAEGLGEHVSRRGRATDEIFDRIILLMKKARKPVLLVLDEVDGLVCKGDMQILHNLACAGAEGVSFGVVATSEDLGALSKFDRGMKDALGFRTIGINGHNKEELRGLLSIKAQKGFVSGSYDDSVIEEIARIGLIHHGNAHIALENLRRAAINAEAKGKGRIEMTDIETESIFDRGQSVEESIIQRILEDGEITSTEFYCAFCRQLIRSKRQIRNYLHAMQAKGAIEMQIVMEGNRPKHTLIRLKNGGAR